MSQAVFDCFPGGKRKALTMGYDDGRTTDRRLVEIFNRHGIRGTFFLNSGKLDHPGCLRREEVGPLFAGHEVAVHTVNHYCLPQLPKERVVAEIVEDRRALEELVGYVVRGLAYPGCDFSDAVVSMLPALGIEYARTCETRPDFSPPEDFHRWPMSCHHRDAPAKAEAFLKIAPAWGRQLLYVMGHSADFDRENNWDLIEKLCARLGRQESVWYATNIEIADYLRAIAAVRCSADGRLLYNPSARPVWFSLWEDLPVAVQRIGSGETLKLLP